MTETYNGWTNRETWAVNVWVSNLEYLQDDCAEFLRGLSEDDTDYDIETKTRDWFESILDVLREDAQLNKTSFDLYDNIRREIGSLWRVNWRELGQMWLDDSEL